MKFSYNNIKVLFLYWKPDLSKFHGNAFQTGVKLRQWTQKYLDSVWTALIYFNLFWNFINLRYDTEGLKAEFQWFIVLYGIKCSFWVIITHECTSTSVFLSKKRCTRLLQDYCSLHLDDMYSLIRGSCIVWVSSKEVSVSLSDAFSDKSIIFISITSLTLTASRDNWCTVGGDGGCRVGEVRAGITFPMPEHKGFKLQ